MKRLKQLCSMLMALCMVLTCVPFSALAAESDTAYALLYDDGTDVTLVFQLTDTPDDSHGDVLQIYEVDLQGSYRYDDDIPWYSERERITTVDFADEIAPVSTAFWFYGFENLTEIKNIDQLDTSNVTDMSFMFAYCESLTELYLDYFDTFNVTNTSYMFAYCINLTTIYALHTVFETVIYSEGMFESCYSIAGLFGTRYNADHTDVEYARADMPRRPGYFIGGGGAYASPPTPTPEATASPAPTATAELPTPTAEPTPDTSVGAGGGTATPTPTGSGIRVPSGNIRPDDPNTFGFGSPQKYTITINRTSGGGGTVTADKSSAPSGETVTLMIRENNGYYLGRIDVRTASGSIPLSSSGLIWTFTMPSADVTVTATFVLEDNAPSATPIPELRVNTPTPTPEWRGADLTVQPRNTLDTFVRQAPSSPVQSPFSDVAITYGLFNEIVWADNRGLMNGYEDGKFRPDKAVSSIISVAVLGRMDDSTLKQQETTATGKWYSPYETWANRKNLLKSDTPGVQDIVLQDTIFSRGSMALLLTRYLKSKGYDVTPVTRVKFEDAAQMFPGEEDAFQYLYSIGVFKGTSSYKMTPRGHLTRAQLAALLERLSGM